MKSRLADVYIPDNLSLPQFLLRRLSRHGNRTAVIDGITDQSLTYSQICHQVRVLSGALWRQYGVTRGHVVCLLLPNCLEYIVLVQAIIQTGATVTVCNPAFKPGELRRQLENSKTHLVITASNSLPMVKAAIAQLNTVTDIILTDVDGGGNYVTMSRLMDAHSDVTLPDIKINPRKDVAIILYSSGTTGQPKGVMITHYNCIATICQFVSPQCGMGAPRDVFLAVTPMFHVYGLNVVLQPCLYLGATLVTLPCFSPDCYLRAIEKYKVTFLHVVPPTMLFLSQHPLVEKYRTNSVHTVFSGAAPLPENVAESVSRRLNADVRQGYGMTEATPGILHSMPGMRPFSCVGVPIPNTEVKVCDTLTGAELSTNQTGEICVRGPQIMLGYLGNPEATAQTIDTSGWLHTGDLGYYSADGVFFIVDRLKELIKCKAFQVAPAELESVLLLHPAVQDAAVVGRPDVSGVGELPTAFIVTNCDVTPQAIIDFMKDNVAPYKQIQGGVFIVKSIPKSPSGKILRNILRDKLSLKHKL